MSGVCVLRVCWGCLVHRWYLSLPLHLHLVDKDTSYPGASFISSHVFVRSPSLCNHPSAPPLRIIPVGVRTPTEKCLTRRYKHSVHSRLSVCFLGVLRLFLRALCARKLLFHIGTLSVSALLVYQRTLSPRHFLYQCNAPN